MNTKDNTLLVDDFNNIDKILAEFRSRNNLIHPYDKVSNKLIDCKISKSDLKALEKSHQQGLEAVSVKDQHLHYYHVLFTSQLSNPQAWGAFPIVDSLNLTLEATDDELARIFTFFESNEGDKNTPIRVKPKIDTKTKNAYRKNRYLKKRHVWLGGNFNQPIYISYGLVGGREYNSQRPVRISLNPSRFTGQNLRRLFKAIYNANVFDNFWESLANANVTRVDMAIDLIGVPTPIIILDSPRTTTFSYAESPENESKQYLQTQYIGKKSSSHFVVYSKVDKKEANKQKHVCTIDGPDKLALYVSRIERVLKVQANGSSRKLRDLADAPFMFKEAHFYSPLAFKELAIRQHEALGKGFLYTLVDSFIEKHGLGSDQVQQTINNKLRLPEYAMLSEKELLQKLYKIMFADMRRSIERYKITFEKEWFIKQQKVILRNVLKFLLPKKYRNVASKTVS